MVLEAAGSQPLAGLRARIDDPSNPVPEDEWRAEVRTAETFGLVTVTGTGDQATIARTTFGDAWAALDRSSDRQGSWCLPGPGRFDVLFYPVPKRPDFPVFAATGPALGAVRQGSWNLVRGNTGAEPNPIGEVEMVSERQDGGPISVWSGVGDPMLSGLHPAHLGHGGAVLDRLASALAERAAPWLARPMLVDGEHREALVLDLRSEELSGDIVGPALFAVTQLDGATVTVISDAPVTDLALTRVDGDDLVGRPRPGTPG
mgnify:CR=1 FL=1